MSETLTARTEDWPTAEGWLPLAVESVDRIREIEDPAVRNLWITQSYADLARRLLGHLHTDQTWCTFAIWASNTAGVSIRGEELPHFVTDLLEGADHHIDAIVDDANDHPPLIRRLTTRLHRSHLERLVTRAVGQVSARIAHGNTLVYAELAPLFVRFLEWLDDVEPSALTDDGIETDLDGLGVPSERDDQLVRTAFRCYAMAVRADDPHERAQLVLAANVAAVLHEQQRLQPDIAAALDAGLIDVGDELDGLCHRWLAGPVRRWLVGLAQRRIVRHVELLWEHIATHLLMTLDVPGQRLHLGRDVPPPADGPMFPAALEHMELPALVALMQEWDPTGGTGRGSGADDWADLHQRMGYITNLFRSRQQVLGLTAPPFTSAELAVMTRLELPASI
ncbi:MAG: hypothetical protein QNJ12_19460 [Ilumatobacter sp.]|uniref:hypothetical protein n=1 Tax=Ilumatobacter sp. TaxID=1967498 RepID=UPI002622148D|nr:hypothetical protein [Ilumatobacter sp.]MDJ0770979.1 hypothetical protein [Ilumatobacter sp.]